MTRAWDKEKFCVPDRNRTHDLPNTGRALYPLSYENSWRARSFNWVHIWQVSCILLGSTLSKSSWVVISLFQNFSEGQTNVSEHFPKIIEDCRRLLKKIRICFDHTPTNSSVVKGTTEKCYQTWYLRMWGYHIVFINLLPLTFVKIIILDFSESLGFSRRLPRVTEDVLFVELVGFPF